MAFVLCTLMSKTLIYNVVLTDSSLAAPKKSLLTNAELRHIRKTYERRDLPTTCKVKVKSDYIFYEFCIRYALCYTYVAASHKRKHKRIKS